MYIGDLHIHSRYSRATSKEAVPEHLNLWAQKKGIHMVGTGDFTHPAWREELGEKLEPAEDGLYRLKPEYRLESQTLHATDPRFVVTGEISSIYKKNGRVRKVHSLILLPSLEDAEKVAKKLETIGNIHSDGRPILGLDCRDLLEILLELSPRSIYIPAHIWTPHFSLFGAFSGFDTVEECFEDLTPYIHAMETGLSSDPPMNWRLSMLDPYFLVSNSDAHSPAKLGREATLFDTEMSYGGLYRAIQTGEGLGGTIEFFPEEGKYHYDGHRKCHLCLSPSQAEKYQEKCPVCGRKLTIGVAHRAEQLSDRPEGYTKADAKPFESLVPLPEVIAASDGHSAASAKVQAKYEEMLRELGPEFSILREVPVEEIQKVAGRMTAEGIRRLREGKVERIPGFDGEYGTIKLFTADELANTEGQMDFFALIGAGQETSPAVPPDDGQTKPENSSQTAKETAASREPEAFGLNPAQQEAVEALDRAVAVIAGPGTGKTRTLIARILYLLNVRKVRPSEITAVTFTNKAAAEMRERLKKELGSARSANKIQIGTFHSICLNLLKEQGEPFILADEMTAGDLAEETIEKFGLDIKAGRFLQEVSRKKTGMPSEIEENAFAYYQERLKEQNALDFDDLLSAALDLAERGKDVSRKSFSYLLVDEFQDISPIQYRLIRGWNQNGRELFVIGDPDQSIYGFRGSDARCFDRLAEDEPGLKTIRLTENYRSEGAIIRGAASVISRNPGGERILSPNRAGEDKIRLVQAAGELEGAIFAAKEINRMAGGIDMLDAQENGAEREGRKVRSFSEIALLYRTRRQAALLEKCLKKEGIPYVVAGREDFLMDRSVRGTVSFFRYVLHPEDEMAGKACCRLLWDLEDGQASDMILEAEAKKFRDGLASAAPKKTLDRWFEELAEKMPQSGAVKNPALDKLRSCSLFYKTMGEFLDSLALGEEGDLKRCGGKTYTSDAVTLMTLHASKGLEFPAVMICGADQGMIPLETDKGETDKEEERRLFFVGMTRAKEELILISTETPSEFLAEIPEAEITRQEARTRKPKEAGHQMSLFEWMAETM